METHHDNTGQFQVSNRGAASRLSNTNNVARFDRRTGEFLGYFVASGSGGLSSARDLIFTPGGDLLVLSAQNDLILRYDGHTGAFLDVFATVDRPSHDGPINLLYGPDGNLYVTAFDGSRVLKLGGSTGNVLGTLLPPSGTTPGYVGLAFGPDGNLYASAIGSREIVLVSV